MSKNSEIGQLDDLALIRMYEGCTRPAFDELHRRYFELTERVIWQTARSSLSREEVLDINQKVWIRVLAIKDRIQPPDRNVVGWLSEIAKNRTIDELRRQGRIINKHVSYQEQAGELANPSSQLDDPVSALESKDLMQKTLSILNPKERIVVFLVYGVDYKHREVAELLDEPINTVSSLVKRAREKIAEFLKHI